MRRNCKLETFFGTPRDRRTSDRFPIAREARYKVLSGETLGRTGTGEIINISSAGVLFSTQHQLIPGQLLELFINWPAQLDGKCQLKLVARGQVVRAEDGRAAISIEDYEFRTRGTAL